MDHKECYIPIEEEEIKEEEEEIKEEEEEVENEEEKENEEIKENNEEETKKNEEEEIKNEEEEQEEKLETEKIKEENEIEEENTDEDSFQSKSDPQREESYEEENEKAKIEDLTESIYIIKENEDKITDEPNMKSCTNLEIIKNKCSSGSMKNEQIGEIFNEIKDNILTQDYKGEDTVIQTENVIFQISTLEGQKNSLNPNISTIDLGECENILKKQYNLTNKDSLIVVKTDIKSEDLSATYVQYEIYDPNTLKQLNLSYCQDVKITVNIPVNLDSDTMSLYDSLSGSGYNLFNAEDDFYNDICAVYTSANGTDMTLEDRKKEIFSMSGNITMCQSGCEFEYYNITTRRAKCDCEAQSKETETDANNIDFNGGNFATSFLSTLTNSNFLVLKCYKLALNFSNFIKNKGRIIMTLIIGLFLILLLIYCINDRKKINFYLQNLIKEKFAKQLISNKNKNKNANKNKNNLQEKKNLKMKNIKNMNKNVSSNNNNKNKNSKNSKNNKKSKKSKKNAPPKNVNTKNKKKSFEKNNSKSTLLNNNKNKLKNLKKNNKVGININIIPIQNINYKKNKKENNKMNQKKKNNNIEIYRSKMITEKEMKTSQQNFINNKSVQNKKNMTEEEINTLEYEKACMLDKRTYFQYYWSLLKKKQLIIFTFLPANDYNLLSIKISLFLLSFSLYFTINGFFFSDDTMHKIHEDQGNFNIIYQIPQIIYSSVISAVINMLLKKLSLSEKNILVIKQIKDLNAARKMAKNIQNCLTIKFVIFLILSTLLLSFFWYFISCFCAVYSNTQIILIKDTLISFGLSMLYPFGLNLLPGLFRLPALRAKNRDKKCLYNTSKLLALI